MGRILMDELFKMGVTFISTDIVENCEEPFYSSIGPARKDNHVVYYLDERCYKHDPKYRTESNLENTF